MTEDDARDWLRQRFDVPRETTLARYVELLDAEAERQNLISSTTRETIWSRHIVDSAQLIGFAPDDGGPWADIGSGAGLPGMVVAILTERPVVLIEPRRLRVAFLEHVADTLGLADRVTVITAKSINATLPTPASVISARAVGALPGLFAGAAHLANRNTIWILPKGQAARSEVAAAKATWQGVFHVEPSITDASSGIIIARGVHRR